MRRALLSTLGGAALVARRRARRDAGLLLAWTVLVALVMMLAAAAPRFVVTTMDGAAREAVAEAGDDADILVSTLVGTPGESDFGYVTPPDGLEELAGRMIGFAPAGVRRVTGSATPAVVGPPTVVTAVNGTAGEDAPLPVLRLAMLAADNRSAASVVDGRLPRTDPGEGGPVEIAVSAATAAAAALDVGDVLEADLPDAAFPDPEAPSSADAGGAISFVVVGIVERSGGAWNQLDRVWRPGTVPGSTAPAITVLASPAGMARASAAYADPFEGTITLRLDPRRFTAPLVSQVAGETDGLQLDPQSLVGGGDTILQVRSDFGKALADFPAQARTALAQMWIMIAGLLGVAATVLVLVSRLLVLRRAPEFALERARGASLASIGLRALAESAATALIGGALGWGIGMSLQPGPAVTTIPVAAVLAIALLAAPVQAVLSARGLWAARRAPANRRDRSQLTANAATRRIALEVTLVALAGAALASLASRGLARSLAETPDPLLATAPLLLAVALAVIMLRVYRVPVRWVGRLARRGRGATGLVGAVRAERSVSVLPLVALALSVAITATGGVLLDTVSTGQVDASWSRTGADVRVDAPVTPAQAAAVAGASGVTAVATSRSIDSVQLAIGPTNDIVTVIAIDSSYAELVDALPPTTGAPGAPAGEASRTLARLATADPAPDAPIPVVVDSQLAPSLVTGSLTAVLEGKNLALEVIGTTSIRGPEGYLFGPFVYLDLDELTRRTPERVGANTLLAVGPGSAAAVAAQGFAPDTVSTRAAWLQAQQGLGLVRGVQQTVLLSALAVALLALVALATTVIASSRDRVRTVALLRTLGARSRIGWWLALAEMAPTVIAAVLAGLASGALFVSIMSRSLGLRTLTGGLLPPAPVVSVALLLALAAAALVLLLAAVVTEVVLHRRDRLGDVLRVGETV